MTGVDIAGLGWELERAAKLLDASGDYRVLKRFAARDAYADANTGDETPPKTALFVDCETTGLDVDRDYVISLALVPFEFDAAGCIYGVGEPMDWLNDPGVPIAAEVTALTGITNDAVKGKAIDWVAVREAINGASLVIAHHADFDRRMMERANPAFCAISWACSWSEIDWAGAGYRCGKLGHLLMDACREFTEDEHHAVSDCLIGIHVLAAAQLDGRSAFAHLLDSARQPSARVFAVGSPFDMKDVLKARGYRWSDGTNGRRKAWYRDVPKQDAKDEVKWAADFGGSREPVLKMLTARDRYSVRSDR